MEGLCDPSRVRDLQIAHGLRVDVLAGYGWTAAFGRRVRFRDLGGALLTGAGVPVVHRRKGQCWVSNAHNSPLLRLCD